MKRLEKELKGLKEEVSTKCELMIKLVRFIENQVTDLPWNGE